jgi:hypothetical protein
MTGRLPFGGAPPRKEGCGPRRGTAPCNKLIDTDARIVAFFTYKHTCKVS